MPAPPARTPDDSSSAALWGARGPLVFGAWDASCRSSGFDVPRLETAHGGSGLMGGAGDDELMRAMRLESLRILAEDLDSASADLHAATMAVIEDAGPNLMACQGIAWEGRAADAFRTAVVALQYDLSELVGSWRLAFAWFAEARQIVDEEIARLSA